MEGPTLDLKPVMFSLQSAVNEHEVPLETWWQYHVVQGVPRLQQAIFPDPQFLVPNKQVVQVPAVPTDAASGATAGFTTVTATDAGL